MRTNRNLTIIFQKIFNVVSKNTYPINNTSDFEILLNATKTTFGFPFKQVAKSHILFSNTFLHYRSSYK